MYSGGWPSEAAIRNGLTFKGYAVKLARQFGTAAHEPWEVDVFGSAILEVGIGLALVYLLLSLFCSVISEWLARIFEFRANFLEQGIRSLFSDGKLTDQRDIAAAIYKHGLIQSLYRPGTKPSYIPSEIFAKALWDVLAPANSSGPKTLAELRVAIALIPSQEAREALQSVVAEADVDVTKARAAIADWYDHGMERVAGWYKRRTQTILIVLALIVAAATNTDSVLVAGALWKNPTLRESTVAVAKDVVEHPPAGVAHTNTAGSSASASVAGQIDQSNGSAKSPDAIAQVEASMTTINALKLPIGWPPSVKGVSDGDVRRWPSSGWMMLSRLLGWFMTAVALSLGAPFWFDGLNTFVNVRSTVKPKPADADGEKK
jgi:hypothetical protein